ncbi:glycoside hydrolase family 3 N-terminal domain-containing protein [Aeromonas veronii]
MKNKLTPLFIATSILLSGCNDDDTNVTQVFITPKTTQQPDIFSRTHPLLNVEGYKFRDANGDGKLQPYEDWRLPSETRAKNLVSLMLLEEKAGMMLIDTLNSGSKGAVTESGASMITNEQMTRFIFRNNIVGQPKDCNEESRSGCDITPKEAATFTNSIQELREKSRLGIPALFKSNARNHIDPLAKAGINVSSGAFSAWPKEAGLAATRDMELIKEFATIMNEEWRSVGLRSMYGYMADLATEPRWFRVHETFSEDADLVSDIIENIISGLQGNEVTGNSVALTIKHFPGGGPQENGADPHYDFGKNQTYPTDNFNYHLKPFIRAIDSGASSIMPYYGIPIGQKYQPNNVGMSFSKGIVTDLLRNELGFTGNVNSDTGIIVNQAWGVEDKTEAERMAMVIDAGVDVISGYHDKDLIVDLVKNNLVSEERINISVQRLLQEQFDLGLFENPYVDSDKPETILGNKKHQERADFAQKKSVVLLQNENHILPLPTPNKDKSISLYVMGMDTSELTDYGYTVTKGDINPTAEHLPIPSGTDYAVIRVFVSNEGAEGNVFGGASVDELDSLSFSEMATANTWQVSPSLPEIQKVMNEVGSEKTILAIYFRQPFVLDEMSKMKDASGIVATFGITDKNLMEVLTGHFAPQGKLPFALANKPEAVVNQASDAPGYPEEDTLFPFGFGLTYNN